MERSLYVDYNKYAEFDKLIDVFREVNQRPRINNDIRKIIPDGTFSNIASQVWMYVNLKESVKEEVSYFSKVFGFFRFGTTYFWSCPGCACNNPRIIRYISHIQKIDSWTIDKFNKLKDGHPLSGRINIKTTDDFRNFYRDILYMDDDYFYVPYQMCDRMISKSPGCSAPTDIGYILYDNPKDLNLTDSTWITRFKCLDGVECVYYNLRGSWVDDLKKPQTRKSRR